MKFLLIYLTLIISLNARIVDIQPPPQIGDLRVYHPLSLKDFFDAGFRPQTVTKSNCIIGPVGVTLLFEENKSYLFEGSRMDLSVDRNDKISILNIDSQIISVVDAEVKIRDILKLNEIQPIALDVIVHEMKDNVLKPTNWNQGWEKNFIFYHISMRPSLHTYYDSSGKVSNKIKSVVSFSVRWKAREVGPSFRTKPIIPPAGYEHVSMKLVTPEDIIFAQSSNDPGVAHLKYSPEDWSKMLAEHNINPSSIPSPQTLSPTPNPINKNKNNSTSESPPSPNLWLTGLIAVVVTVGLLWLWRKVCSS